MTEVRLTGIRMTLGGKGRGQLRIRIRNKWLTENLFTRVVTADADLRFNWGQTASRRLLLLQVQLQGALVDGGARCHHVVRDVTAGFWMIFLLFTAVIGEEAAFDHFAHRLRPRGLLGLGRCQWRPASALAVSRMLNSLNIPIRC